MSRYKFDANDILVKVQNFYALQRRGPGLLLDTKLSWVQELSAKLVTSLLILLSVLAAGIIILSYNCTIPFGLSPPYQMSLQEAVRILLPKSRCNLLRQ